MAIANLGRNKKRTVTVICSLTLGLVLLSCFYAKNAAFDLDKYVAELTIADFQLADVSSDNYNGYNPQGTTLNENLVAQVEDLAGLEETGHLYTHQISWKMDEGTTDNIAGYYTSEIMAEWSRYDPFGAQAAQKAIDTKTTEAVIYGLDGIPLDIITQERYLLAGSFDAKEFATGKYVLAIGPAVEKDSLSEEKNLPTASVGARITLAGIDYTVMAVVYPLSPVSAGAGEAGRDSEFTLDFVLPADTFRTLWPESTLRKLYFNVSDAGLTQAQNMLINYVRDVDSSLPMTSRETMQEQYQDETRSAAVMGNVISLVIALVGILNFVNSMVTAIVSRKKEFAMIQSIGMTKRQLCRMLVYEGLDYAAITLLASYLIGSIAVGFGVRLMVEGGYTTFHFTLFPQVVCTPVLIMLAIIIPYLCFRNLGKQSIVERLRTND